MAKRQSKLKYQLLFMPEMDCSIDLRDGYVEAIRAAIKHHLSMSTDGKLGELFGFSDDDQNELKSCKLAFSRLTEKSDDLDERALRRRAEEFLDDYFFLKPDDARNFVDEVVAFVAEQQELSEEIRAAEDEE